LGRVQEAFEHGILNPLAIVLAGFRHSMQTRGAFRVRCAYSIKNFRRSIREIGDNLMETFCETCFVIRPSVRESRMVAGDRIGNQFALVLQEPVGMLGSGC
jgi:hypothetical protein